MNVPIPKLMNLAKKVFFGFAFHPQEFMRKHMRGSGTILVSIEHITPDF
jgi:hypothetical protein